MRWFRFSVIVDYARHDAVTFIVDNCMLSIFLFIANEINRCTTNAISTYRNNFILFF